MSKENEMTIPTLAVPAPLYDEALAFCNARLANHGQPRIDALPAGFAANGASCPCGLACGVYVGNNVWALNVEEWVQELTSKDGHPTRFVRYFDRHARLNEKTLPVRDESLAVPP